MKKAILILLLSVCMSSYAQQRLLTKKIVYKEAFTENSVASLTDKDSVAYNYIVNKRFFWEAMDGLIDKLKSKKLYLTSFEGDSLVWDTVFNDLTKRLNALDLKKYSKKEVEKVLENEIRSIKFMEEWTYNPQTMLIDKKITAYCPVIQRDSAVLEDEDMKAKEYFSYDLGWIRQNPNSTPQDSLLICRNIQYTLPIYNTQPYRWWDSNLEAEYSIVFFDMLTSKAEEGSILCYDNPDAVEPFSKSEFEKRKKHSVTTTVYTDLSYDNTIEKDTVITVSYNSEDIDHLRFGEEIYYDKKNAAFFKHVNYYAPVIKINSAQGAFLGYYPLFYIRKK
ncbi:MAG: hypothetical protein J6P44_01630 [Bacteroidales bacterium]|nr:hypothetical protein [Bacteroidales bacterium]